MKRWIIHIHHPLGDRHLVDDMGMVRAPTKHETRLFLIFFFFWVSVSVAKTKSCCVRNTAPVITDYNLRCWWFCFKYSTTWEEFWNSWKQHRHCQLRYRNIMSDICSFSDWVISCEQDTVPRRWNEALIQNQTICTECWSSADSVGTQSGTDCELNILPLRQIDINRK